MYLRYFACIDESELGRTAALYCEALVALGKPVRLLPTVVAELQVDAKGRSNSAWDRYRSLMVTPTGGVGVNVVCCAARDWMRLHTAGMKNVLLIAPANAVALEDVVALDAIAKYDLLFAASPVMRDLVEVTTGLRAVIVPVGTKAAAAALQGVVA